MENGSVIREEYHSEALDAIARDPSRAAQAEADDSALRREYEERGAWGLLASIDLHECNRDAITSPEKIRQFVIELCEKIDMTRHGECLVERFGNGDLEGYSVFQFIETSCVSAHFDEKVANAAYIDIFSCKYFDPYKASDFAQEFFGAKDYTMTRTLRK